MVHFIIMAKNAPVRTKLRLPKRYALTLHRQYYPEICDVGHYMARNHQFYTPAKAIAACVLASPLFQTFQAQMAAEAEAEAAE